MTIARTRRLGRRRKTTGAASLVTGVASTHRDGGRDADRADIQQLNRCYTARPVRATPTEPLLPQPVMGGVGWWSSASSPLLDVPSSHMSGGQRLCPLARLWVTHSDLAVDRGWVDVDSPVYLRDPPAGCHSQHPSSNALDMSMVVISGLLGLEERRCVERSLGVALRRIARGPMSFLRPRTPW